MSTKHNFRNLEVWKKSRSLVKDIYVLTQAFPENERFGLTSQFRRAAVSISLNVSEGSGRSSDKDFSHFLDMAYGSSLEVENLVLLSHDLNLISLETHNELIGKVTEIEKMIKGFQSKINSKSGFLKSVFFFLFSFLFLLIKV